jgi:hypothetical protein
MRQQTTKRKSSPPSTAAHAPGYSDDTGARIRAYLASVELLPGSVHDLTQYQRGWTLIQRLAESATGEDSPTFRLSAEEAATVLRFIAESQPVTPRTWWEDPKDGPSHWAAFTFVLAAVEATLRGVPAKSGGNAL